MKPTSPPWQWSLLVRLIIEITRTLSLLAVFALTVLFLAGGLAQLYVDGNSFTSSDLSNLVPGIQDIKVAWDKYHEALLAEHIANTLWATLTGLALGIGVGLLLAALMDLTPILRWLLYPILILSQTIPIFAIAVVLILIFGFGFGPKIVVVMLFSFYPITVSTLAGLQSVDRYIQVCCAPWAQIHSRYGGKCTCPPPCHPFSVACALQRPIALSGRLLANTSGRAMD
jgi:ABC-type nitrate/sulfonate/bicarbonate transport system permease component